MAEGGSAYTRLEKPDNSISQGLQYWGGIAAKQGEEFRNRAEREDVRAKKEIADWEKQYNYKYEDFKSIITGFNTYDQVKADYTNNISDKYVDLNRKAYDAKKNGDLAALRKYESQMVRLKGTFKQINDADTIIAKRHEEYMKAAQEGKISGVDRDNWEAEMQKLLKSNYRLDIDENGNPMIHGIKKLSDGSEIPFSIPFSQVVDGSWRYFDKQQLAGKNGLIDKALQNLGKRKVDERTGNIITTSQVWDETREKAAQDHTDILLSNPEIMADLYNQMTDGNSRKKSGFTKEEEDSVRGKLMEMIKAGYDEETKTTVDTKESDQRQRGLQHEDRMKLGWAKLQLDNIKTDIKKNNPKLSTGQRKELELEKYSLFLYKIAKPIYDAGNDKNKIKKIMEHHEIDFSPLNSWYNWLSGDNIEIGGKTTKLKHLNSIMDALSETLNVPYNMKYIMENKDEYNSKNEEKKQGSKGSYLDVLSDNTEEDSDFDDYYNNLKSNK